MLLYQVLPFHQNGEPTGRFALTLFDLARREQGVLALCNCDIHDSPQKAFVCREAQAQLPPHFKGVS